VLPQGESSAIGSVRGTAPVRDFSMSRNRAAQLNLKQLTCQSMFPASLHFHRVLHIVTIVVAVAVFASARPRRAALVPKLKSGLIVLASLPFTEILDALRSNVIVDGDRSRLGLTVLVVDSFVLSLLDATVGLANVIDVGFLRTSLWLTRR
jgi:hypothetical protein